MKRKVISKVIGISVMFLIIGLMLGDLAGSQGGIINANPSQPSLSTGTPTVPFFSQRDQRWKDDPIIDETGIRRGTIGSIGCAMTCTAMILKYYGVDTDPKQLNSWLNANKGYIGGETKGGALKWRKPADYSQGKVIYRDDLSKPTPQDWPTNNDWWEDLNQNLKQGRLVVVCVDAYLSTPQLETHYVLVTGFKGGAVNYPGNYYINDPWDLTFNPDKTLLTYWDRTYDNTFFAMHVYESSQPTPTYPKPTISVSDNENVINVDKIDWVKFTVKNEGTEYTSSWGIQVKVGDGLELVQHSSYPWNQKVCNDRAAEWYKFNRLNPGDSDYILVGIKGKRASNYESVWYTAWMYDPDGKPQPIQYAHPVRNVPCDRDYAEYGVIVQPSPTPNLLGIDTASNTKEYLDCFKNRGISFIGRYVVPNSWKSLTRDEAKAISEKGMYIVSIWEVGNTPSYYTYEQGKKDAEEAFNYASSVGQPFNTPIYFAVDFDATLQYKQNILDYFRGIKDKRREMNAPYEIGVYGSYWVLDWTKEQGIATYFYQAYAPGWCGGKNKDDWPGYNIRQKSSQYLSCNNQIYVDDDIASGDFGGWKFTTPPPSTQTITVTTVSTVTTMTNVALTYTTTTYIAPITWTVTATLTRLTTIYSPTYTITESLTVTGFIIQESSTPHAFLGVTLTISLCILGLLFLSSRKRTCSLHGKMTKNFRGGGD